MKGDNPLLDLLVAQREMDAIVWCASAMPYADHDGGDEDDQLVRARRFARAAAQPGARIVHQGNRLFVIQKPNLDSRIAPWPMFKVDKP